MGLASEKGTGNPQLPMTDREVYTLLTLVQMTKRKSHLTCSRLLISLLSEPRPEFSRSSGCALTPHTQRNTLTAAEAAVLTGVGGMSRRLCAATVYRCHETNKGKFKLIFLKSLPWPYKIVLIRDMSTWSKILCKYHSLV